MRGAVCLRIRVGGNRDLDPFAGRFRVPDRENPATGFLPKSELSADVIHRIVNGGGIQWRCAALLMVAFRGWSAGGLAEVHQ